MMNALALGLVLTSLLTAGFFTPSPENKKSSQEDVIVKEGHRVVVVEFEKDDHHTKVLISPQDSEKGFPKNAKEESSEKNIEDAEEKIKESLPSSSEEKEITRPIFRPRELICDAYGKCKHKIASAFEKTKDTVAEKAHEAAGKVHEVEEGAKQAAGDAAGKVKDTVTDTAHQAFDKMAETKESVKDSAGEAKDKVVDKASEIKQGARERAQDVIDKTKEVKHDVEEDASKKMEETKEDVEKAKEGARRVKKEGEKELGEIMHRAHEVGVDVFDYAFSFDRLASLGSVLHLMGFASAYGMCVWVTFASSYVLAEALPRHQFGMVQSKIYPVYFRSMAYSVGMAMLGHLMSKRMSVGMFLRGFDLLAPLVMILVNLLYLEPRAAKVMHERMKKEKEDGRGKEGQATEPASGAVDSTPERAGRGGVRSASADDEGRRDAAKAELVGLSGKLQKVNSYSSFLNVLTLVCLTWHLVRLGQRLHTAC